MASAERDAATLENLEEIGARREEDIEIRPSSQGRFTMSETLNQRQLVFVENYVLLGNATEAAKAAGYRGARTTLASVGGENLKKPLIRAAIERRQRDLRERTIITLEKKRMRLWEIACACRQSDPAAAIKAIHELNLMDGDVGGTRTIGRAWSFEEVLKQVIS